LRQTGAESREAEGEIHNDDLDKAEELLVPDIGRTLGVDEHEVVHDHIAEGGY
jgi:hypothetical protein